MKASRCFNLTLVFVAMVAVTGLGGCAGSNENFRAKLSADTHLTGDPVEDLRKEKSPLPKLTSEDYERRGDAYLERGNFSMAFMEYENSLKLNPKNVEVLYKSGLTFLLAGKNQDAVQQFQAVIQLDPKHALAYEELGRAFFQMRQYGKAEENLKKAQELNPELWQANAFLGMVYDKQQKYPRPSVNIIGRSN